MLKKTHCLAILAGLTLIGSASAQQPMVIEAIQAGASDFIVKPFQPERVVEALNKALS